MAQDLDWTQPVEIAWTGVAVRGYIVADSGEQVTVVWGDGRTTDEWPADLVTVTRTAADRWRRRQLAVLAWANALGGVALVVAWLATR